VKAILFGATRGMGRSLARELAARDARLALLGRDAEELGRSARDLEVRGAAGTVSTHSCDLALPDGFGPALDAAVAALAGCDLVVVTAGAFATQAALEADRRLAEQLLTLDFTNTVLFCEAARERLLAQGGGTLCVFSSVAGDRGRKPVVLYGAAKAGLSAYLEGLDHKFRSQGLRTVCVKPGFVRTSMTAGLRPPPFAGDPESVARIVMRAILRGTPVVYAPSVWGPVMAAIRRMPRSLMRSIDF
jgi:short-subunit dehydrogenase